MVRIEIGDNLEVLAREPAESIDLIITSPPYADLRADSLAVRPAAYSEWFLPRAAQMMRVLKPTGSFVLNIGSCVVDGFEHPYLHRLILDLHDQGWRMAQEHAWCKVNWMPGRFGKRCAPAWEPIFHLVKTREYFWDDSQIREPYASRRHLGRPKSALRDPSGTKQDFYRAGGSLPPNYVVANKAGKADGASRHSAVFPAWLPARWIRCACPPAGTVCDPFAGSGTTGVAARALERDCLLIERDPSHEQTIRDRVNLEQADLFAGPAAVSGRQVSLEE